MPARVPEPTAPSTARSPQRPARSPSRRRRRALAAVSATGLVVTGLATTGATASSSDVPVPQRMVQAVTLDGTVRHLTALQQAADVNGGDRAAGTSGYAASAGYVAGQLTAAGYDVELQPFDFPFFGETAPAVLERTAPEAEEYALEEDFASLTYSGSGDVTGSVVPVDVVLPAGGAPNASTSGCEASDFEGFPAGSIALVQRGTCAFFDKASNAFAAGAAAVIVFNEGQEGRTGVIAGTLGADVGGPVVGTTYEVGVELARAGTEVRVSTSTVSETRTTYNVLAETRGGRSDNVVMVGAHLDSVDTGPGISDNGTGSAAVLETAIQMARVAPEPTNKVRFAWWSAEELGLLGAAHYVEELTTTERGSIALYMNFDMVGSPNFGRFIYDGDDSDGEGAGAGPQGSGAVEDVFETWYERRGLPYQGTDFTGRSDYGPFIAEGVGIPAGGLFTGAEGIKTEEQAELFGGTAGEAYDPCYHTACDTLRNVDFRALGQNADAIAFATGVFARSTETVNGRGRGNRSSGAQVADLASPEAAGLSTT